MHKFFNKCIKTLILFTLVFFLIQYSKQMHGGENVIPSQIYNNFLIGDSKNCSIMHQTKYLTYQYRCSFYSDLLRLELAKELTSRKNFLNATKHLKSLIRHSRSAHLRGVAALRIARIYISLDCPDLALLTLTNMSTLSHPLSKDVLLGYAYLAKNDSQHANECWNYVIEQISESMLFNYNKVFDVLIMLSRSIN